MNAVASGIDGWFNSEFARHNRKEIMTPDKETQALLERLRTQVQVGMFAMDNPVSFGECLDTIEALTHERDALAEALEPFASFADHAVDAEGWSGPMRQERIVDWFGPTDFRKARAALTPADEREIG